MLLEPTLIFQTFLFIVDLCVCQSEANMMCILVMIRCSGSCRGVAEFGLVTFKFNALVRVGIKWENLDFCTDSLIFRSTSLSSKYIFRVKGNEGPHDTLLTRDDQLHLNSTWQLKELQCDNW